MKTYLWAGIFAYITAFAGFFAGGLFSFRAKRLGRGSFSLWKGFCGGFLLADICFILLPMAFQGGAYYPVVFSMLAGALGTAAAEDKFLRLSFPNAPFYMIVLCTGFVLGLGGFSIWLSVTFYLTSLGIRIVENFTSFSYSFLRGCIIFLLLAFVTAAAAFCGAWLAGVYPFSASVLLGCGGGSLLYTACSTILPESLFYRGAKRLIAGALAGFILGSLFLF